MRTKALLIAAASLAAGIVTSNAQVYSQNIVGYTSTPTPAATFVAFANQLDYDGTGTNNNVNTVFGTNLLAGTTIQAWLPGSGTFTSASWIKGKSGLAWSGDTNDVNAALNVGGGVFVDSATTSNTFVNVGNVIQGTNIISLVAGYNFVSDVSPIGGYIDTNLNYSPSVGDNVQVWNQAGQTYSGYNYIKGKSGNSWSPSDPIVPAGAAVFISTGSAKTWTNTFTAQ